MKYTIVVNTKDGIERVNKHVRDFVAEPGTIKMILAHGQWFELNEVERTILHEESDMSRLSDDEKRYLTDQITMLKNENERLTKYVEYSKDDKECMQNEIDVLKEAKSILLAIGVTLTQCIGNIKLAGITDEELEDMKRIHADILEGK